MQNQACFKEHKQAKISSSVRWNWPKFLFPSAVSKCWMSEMSFFTFLSLFRR